MTTSITKPALTGEILKSISKQKLYGKKIYVLMGASGSGKTTVGNYLKDLGIPEIISHTTRPKREGEIEGVTYYYVTEKEFEKIPKVEEVQYGKHYYGISKEEIDLKLKSSDRLFVICDVHGMEQVKSHYPDEVTVIYLYTTIEEMVKRMKNRGDSDENIQLRIEYAEKTNELGNGILADFIVENEDLEKTKDAVRNIILCK